MNKKRPSAGGEIIRVQHDRAHPYVVSSRALPEDERLSWAARGLLWYLLAKPDTWQVMFNDLLRAGDAGRDRLRGLLRELETVGYLGRARIHNAQGHWQWVSTIYENPADREPSPEKPSMVEPPTVEPSTVKASIQEASSGANTERSKNETDPPAISKNGSGAVPPAFPAQIRRDRPDLVREAVAQVITDWQAGGVADWLVWWQDRRSWY